MKQIGLLLRKEWTEKRTFFIFFTIVALLISIGVISYYCYVSWINSVDTGYFFFSTEAFMMPYIVTIFVWAIISPYIAFRDFKKRKSAIYEWLIPATPTQKWLVKWFIYCVLFFIFFTILYGILYYISAQIVDKLDFVNTYAPEDFGLPSFSHFIGIGTVICLMAQSIFFAGVLFFNKFSMFFTTFSFFLWICFMIALNSILGEYGSIFFDTVLGVEADEGMGYYAIHKNSENIKLLLILLFYIGIFMLYTLSYFKFKEKEIR